MHNFVFNTSLFLTGDDFPRLFGKKLCIKSATCYISGMGYEVKPYKRGGWVIAEIESGRELILYNRKDQAEETCRFLNQEENLDAENP